MLISRLVRRHEIGADPLNAAVTQCLVFPDPTFSADQCIKEFDKVKTTSWAGPVGSAGAMPRLIAAYGVYRQDGRHFPDEIFRCIFFNENVWISIKIWQKFVLKATSHCLNQWWLVYWRTSYAPLDLNELMHWSRGDVQNRRHKQRVLMHRHQGLNVRHGLCHIYMRYLYIYELFIAFVCFVVCSLL